MARITKKQVEKDIRGIRESYRTEIKILEAKNNELENRIKQLHETLLLKERDLTGKNSRIDALLYSLILMQIQIRNFTTKKIMDKQFKFVDGKWEEVSLAT